MEITSIVNADLFELNVLTYNIFIPVLKPIRDYGQFERAERVAEVIIKCQEITGKDVDIVILNEVSTGSDRYDCFRRNGRDWVRSSYGPI